MCPGQTRWMLTPSLELVLAKAAIACAEFSHNYRAVSRRILAQYQSHRDVFDGTLPAMGTSSDWVKVAILSIWFPGFSILAVFILNRKGHRKPALTPLDILSWAFAGLSMGLWGEFGWNAFRWPLVLSLVGSVIGFAVFGKLAQRNFRNSAETH